MAIKVYDGDVAVRITVNEVKRSGIAEPRTLLSDFIRHELDLTGTHVGCEHGVCGACTVRIDGRLVRSCITFAVQVDGAEIETVEGMAATVRVSVGVRTAACVEPDAGKSCLVEARTCCPLTHAASRPGPRRETASPTRYRALPQ